MSPPQPLRGSCNACHKSKTKCTYTDSGICNRCTYMDIDCVRAPSQRKGKPKGAKNHRSSGVDAATRYGITKPLPTPPRSRANSSSPQSTHPSAEKSPLSLDPCSVDDMPVDTLDFLNFNTDLTNSMNMNFQEIPIDYCHIPTLPSADALENFFGSFDVALQEDHSRGTSQSHTFSSQQQNRAPFASRPSQMSVSSAENGSLAFPDIFALSPVSSSSKTSSPLPSARTEGVHLQSRDSTSCSCFSSITRKLEKLQHDSIHHLPLDIALTRNKETLATVCHTLRCDASHDSTVTILLLALLRKILFSYRDMYQTRFSSGGSVVASTRLPSNDNDNNAGSFKLGSYTLDKGDETSLKQQILLLDLKKVPRLLGRMEARANSSKDEQEELESLAVYRTLRELLSTEFQKTLEAMT